MAIGQKTKRLLVLVAIPVIGAILLNLTFIADFLFQTAIDRIFGIDYATPILQKDHGCIITHLLSQRLFYW